MRYLWKFRTGGFVLLSKLHFDKESPQDNGVAVYQQKRIHSVYVEPSGLCAMTSL
jgi:hypothetical protein